MRAGHDYLGKDILKADSNHQKALDEASQQSEDELRRRLEVRSYKDPNFLPSEVLVSFFKLQFGRASGLLDAIVGKLNQRILGLVEKLLETRGKGVRGSEQLAEDATHAVWEALLKDSKPVGRGFAEIRFVVFVKRRLSDFLSTARTQQGDAILMSELDETDEDGEEVPFEDTVAGDKGDQPESEAMRNQLKERLTQTMTLKMPKKEKLAVYFRLEQDYDWQKTADLMGCSIPTARKYYAQGVKRLLGEMNK